MHCVGAWIALHVLPRRERNVATLIGQMGYEFFLPTYKVRRKWSDRIKVLELPLFPGYIFCRIANQGVSGLMIATPGVIRIISANGKPCPVTDQEIEVLKRVVSSEVEVSPSPYLMVGRKVRVREGPLSGVTGIITRVNNRTRLVVSVDG